MTHIIPNIMKKFKDYQKEQEYLLSKYKDVLFSDIFYERLKDESESEINQYKKIFLEKIEKFIDFYTMYNTKNIRINNGVDSYEVAKSIYDKIINGELYIDKELRDPDNILRNIIMLLDIDKYKAMNNKQ